MPPKVKITTEREVSSELEAIGQDLISDLSPNLANARIVYILQTRINEESGKAVAPKVGEKYGSVRAMGVLHRMIHHEDFWIVISGNWWAKLSDHQKKAMLYRHLCACYMHNGKPVLQKPDFVGFNSEIKHFGAWCEPLESAQEILSPQMRLISDETAEQVEQVAEAAEQAVALAADQEDPFGEDDEAGAEEGLAEEAVPGGTRQPAAAQTGVYG